MTEPKVGDLGHRRRRRRRLAGGAAGLALVAGAGAGGFLVISGGAASADRATPPQARLSSALGQRPAHMPAVVGTVESVDSATNSFTVKDLAGNTTTVDVSATTTYRDRGVASPSLADVTVGAHVAVLGTTTAGTVSATSVLIGDLRPDASGDHLGGRPSHPGPGAGGWFGPGAPAA